MPESHAIPSDSRMTPLLVLAVLVATPADAPSVAAVPLAERVDEAGLAWLVAGGLSYTGGVVFYAWESLPFGHAVWHLFVAAGSTCHALAVHWHSAGRVG